MAEKSRESYYKLYYFGGIRGRAEATRIMFHLAQVKEFEDVEVVGDQWKELKPSKSAAALAFIYRMIVDSSRV